VSFWCSLGVLGLVVALFTLCNWLRPLSWVFYIYNITYKKKKNEGRINAFNKFISLMKFGEDRHKILIDHTPTLLKKAKENPSRPGALSLPYL
jgi:hypothetical protein